ncbi:MAG: hypothetical protein COB20_04720 [SAR86 cluster bacterium]|uniref:UGSC-like domain-containing protein n=1 Tax=SAR86 cluster bacterium TaxID=2030880 RepID=A0A2A4XBI4_9GAMM|nr:MAG: hypothetical protein COB20_04720 [SAR86 cluster bacterium]
MGTPAVGVMTSKFVSAAELMAKVLGMPDYAFSIIDHPVSSASDQELEARALQTMAAIEEQILL